MIASAAIPGILNPVVLMRKRADGSLVPFSYGGRGFKDGSLRADIPLQVRLRVAIWISHLTRRDKCANTNIPFRPVPDYFRSRPFIPISTSTIPLFPKSTLTSTCSSTLPGVVSVAL